jgi:hypothetical protein
VDQVWNLRAPAIPEAMALIKTQLKEPLLGDFLDLMRELVAGKELELASRQGQAHLPPPDQVAG